MKRMKGVAPWLLPTFLGPIAGASLYVLLVSRGSSLPGWAWVIVAAVASGFSLAVGAMMAVTDVALLKMKLREPPTGWRAWVMGVAAPVPVLWTWQTLAKFAIGGLPQLLLTFFLPMIAVALVMRIALGTRPASWKKR